MCHDCPLGDGQPSVVGYAMQGLTDQMNYIILLTLNKQQERPRLLIKIETTVKKTFNLRYRVFLALFHQYFHSNHSLFRSPDLILVQNCWNEGRKLRCTHYDIETKSRVSSESEFEYLTDRSPNS